ncbi:MAG: PspC domain-containing protein [Bacillota bacterium]
MEKKRICRSKTNRLLAGVCGGLGEYFDVDPTLIRLLWVASALAGGLGLLFYIICIIVIPSRD